MISNEQTPVLGSRPKETAKFLNSPRPTMADGILAGLIALLALAIRLWNMRGAQVGQDDVFSLIVTQLPLRQMIGQIVADYVQPPLHYFLLAGWLRVFGFRVLTAQLLSVFFGVLSIPVLYYFAHYMFGRRVAVLSSLFAAMSGSAVFLSRACRPYSQLQALTLVASYLFIRSLRERKPSYWWAYIASCMLILYTHYYAAFVILAHLVFGLVYRKRYSVKLSWVLSGALVIVASYIPWLTSGIIQAAIHHPKVIAARSLGQSLPGKSTPVRLGLVLHMFNNGVHGYLTSPWWWTYVAGFLLFTAPVFWGLWAVWSRRNAGRQDQKQFREGLAFCGILFLVPLAAFAGFDALGVQSAYRYVSYCGAPYYILTAFGLTVLPSSLVCAVVIALNLTYSGFALRGEPYFVRDNLFIQEFTRAFRAVEDYRISGDGGILMPYGLRYASDLTLMERSESDIVMPTPRSRSDRLSFRAIPSERLPADLSKCDRVWVISWRCGPLSRSSEPTPLLASHLKIQQQNFGGFELSLYSRRK